MFAKYLLAVGTLLWFTAAAAADDPLASGRFHFQKAELALSRGDRAAFREHRQKVGDYPLAIYLDYEDLRHRLGQLPLAEIEQFLISNSESYLARRLRQQVLGRLAISGRHRDYLRFYDENLPSTELTCHAIRARLESGDTSAFAEVPVLWDVPHSQPEACDPVFSRWKAAGHLTEELVWSRFAKAVAQSEMGLAQYLKGQLSESKPLADLFLQVHKRPTLVKQRSLFSRPERPFQEMVALGIARMALREPVDALYQWELYEAQQLFPEDLALATKHEVVKRLIREGHLGEARRILSYSHTLRKHELVEELLREALAEQDWERFEEGLALLDVNERSDERWLYWRARAQDALGKSLPNFKPSAEVYRALAANRSFYGFLAADMIGAPYSFADESRPLPEAATARVVSHPGMERARELFVLGQIERARTEWLYTSRQLDADELLVAGELARDWGWYSSGIRAMADGSLWNQLTVRFPIAYRDAIAKNADATAIEPTFLYAIARQESAFDERARSPVGAMGLMQIMPETAKFTAKTYGIRHDSSRQLLDVSHNITLGSRYLHYLLGRFDNNRILAAAAYNAGPHRVNRWLSPEEKKRPFDVWIETIPFKETRNYVQNVLCYQVIYGYRLGTPVSFISTKEARSYL